MIRMRTLAVLMGLFGATTACSDPEMSSDAVYLYSPSCS